jgi:hypothetical protein
LAAVTVACGTVAASTAAGASAQTPSAATPHATQTVFTYTGDAGATALHLEVNVPQAPQLSIAEDISLSNGHVAGAGGDPAHPTGEAQFLKSAGLLQPILDNLDQHVVVDAAHPSDTKDLIPHNGIDGLLGLGVGHVAAAVTPAAASASSTGQAQVAAVTVGLKAAAAVVDQLTAQLNSGLDQIISGVNGVLPQLTDPLSSLVGQIPGLGGQLQAALNGLPNTLNLVKTQIQAALSQLTTDDGVANIQLIQVSHTVKRVGDSVTASSTSQIGGVKLLSGLLNLGLVKSGSTATANGKPGGASSAVNPDPTIADLQVGSGPLAEVQVTVNGITADLQQILGAGVLSDALKTQLSTLLNQVLSQLNQALAMIGVQAIDLGSSKTAAADGTSATASTKGIGLTVNLPPQLADALGVTKPLVAIQLAPSAASVQARAVPQPVIVPPAPAHKSPAATKKKLAYTGADLPLAAGVALLLVGAAIVLRRRMGGTR